MTMPKIIGISVLFLSILILFIPTASTQTNCLPNSTAEETQANLVGEVTDDGGDPNLEVRFQYGQTINYGLESSIAYQYGTGDFCATVYNLSPCTIYNYRAAGKNSANTSYGENKTLTTKCSPVLVDLKANNSDGPVSISYKNYINLSWTSSNAASCQASGDWSGTKAISGSQVIQMNQVKAYTFTLTCQDSMGIKADADSVLINVTPNPPTVITKPAVVTY